MPKKLPGRSCFLTWEKNRVHEKKHVHSRQCAASAQLLSLGPGRRQASVPIVSTKGKCGMGTIKNKFKLRWAEKKYAKGKSRADWSEEQRGTDTVSFRIPVNSPSCQLARLILGQFGQVRQSIRRPPVSWFAAVTETTRRTLRKGAVVVPRLARKVVASGFPRQP